MSFQAVGDAVFYPKAPVPAFRNATIAAGSRSTECGVFCGRRCARRDCAPLLAAAQQQPSDYAREKRWADEIVPQLVVGEPVWLEAPRTEKFLGIYAEAKNAKSAIILAHGLGVHPDYGLIGELRTRLAEAGYTTLSIQMPILGADAPPARYPVLFWEADARFAAAMTYLRRKRYDKIVVVSHSMGSRMANHYISAHPQVPLAGWITFPSRAGTSGRFKEDQISRLRRLRGKRLRRRAAGRAETRRGAQAHERFEPDHGVRDRSLFRQARKRAGDPRPPAAGGREEVAFRRPGRCGIASYPSESVVVFRARAPAPKTDLGQLRLPGFSV